MPCKISTRPPSRARPLAPALSRLSAALFGLLLAASPALADGPYTYAPAGPPPVAPAWGPTGPGAFVTALCRDPQGRAVVATEGQGVWRLEPTSGQYAHFTRQDTQDGLASDDVYALAVDAKRRLWAGTLRGLSVYNGLSWKTYGLPEGLAGSRVFALAVCPKDGDVWCATEGGLTRYSLKRGTWQTYSRLDGLPSDALSCLAFDTAGNLYVGTQADGVAVASRRGDYTAWRVTPGPSRMPNVPDGRGLPSSLVNCLLVSSRDGSVYAGTDGGLARSKDGGRHWRFLRGADWAALARAYRGGAAPEETYDPGDRMGESYVTALAEVNDGGDGAGHLLVGHRRAGLDVFDERTGLRLPSGTGSLPGDYVTSLLPWPGQTALIGFYGGGVATLANQSVSPTPHAAPPLTFGRLPPLPTPAAPPTLAQLNALLRVAEGVRPDPREFRPHALALDDDWATGGDWLGRYGRYWACLCAICSPQDYLWGAGWEPVDYAARMGPDRDKGDSLRYWVQWLYTDDPRVLEMPPTYLDSRIQKGLTTPALPRREAEQDDHGEAYDEVKDGPGIFFTVTVPPGLYTLSLYDVNYNGHAPGERSRDYRLSVRPRRGAHLADIADFAGSPEWAHGRIAGFWGGAWKRLLVRGPVALTVQVDRGHGFNTMLPAVMLDLVDEAPPPYFGTVAQWRTAQAQQQRQWRGLLARACPSVRFRPARTEAEAADRLLGALGRARGINSAWWAENARRDYGPLLRWYAARAARPGSGRDARLWRRLASCYYEAGLYPEWEQGQRLAGLTPARDTEKALKWDGVSEGGEEYSVVAAYQAKAMRSRADDR